MNKNSFPSIKTKSRGGSSGRAAANILLWLGVGLIFLLVSGCTNTDKAIVTVDRNNPESVLQAYFGAWQRGDWSTLASFMDEKYAQMVQEPVESIRIIEIQSVPNSSLTERTYHVIFEIKMKGQGVSLRSGRYDWSYYLTWSAQRKSWIISNYGAG